MQKIISALLLFVLIGCTASESKEIKVTKPNILLIIADDHGYADMSINQLAEDVQTPNLDKLAQSGTRFTNAFATSPICSPSRV
ncbi:MAG: sulfatase-like hydrolase/transferase, partial [Bacteroidota bacterium]